MGFLDFLGNIGGPIVSSAAGLFTANRQNKLARKMQREQNEWNNQQRLDQNSWNLQMWNRENEYNSASAQRHRIESAGLNPYLMMNGGDAGSASSLTGQPATTSLGVSPSTYNPASDINQAFMQLSDQLFRKDNVAADTASKYADAKSKLAEVGVKIAQADFTRWQKERGQKMLPYEMNLADSQAFLNDAQKDVQKQERLLKYRQTMLASAQTIAQNLVNYKDGYLLKYLDTDKIVELAQGMATAAYYSSQANLSKKQQEFVNSQIAYQGILNEIKGMERDKIKSLLDDEISTERWKLSLDRLNSETEYWKNLPQLRYHRKALKSRSDTTQSWYYQFMRQFTEGVGEVSGGLVGPFVQLLK